MNDSSNYSGSHKNFEKVEPNLSSSNTVISRSSFLLIISKKLLVYTILNLKNLKQMILRI